MGMNMIDDVIEELIEQLYIYECLGDAYMRDRAWENLVYLVGGKG